MPIDARRMIRKMRGGAQAHLIECDDGRYYVVKFANNPQHRRVLVNEWIGAVFLRHIGLATPETATVRFSPEFLQANPEVCVQRGSTRASPSSGWHFGSRYPVDPMRQMVWDILPDGAVEQVENVHDLIGALAFDKWASNADARQSVFFRARIRDPLPAALIPPRPGFVTQLIDNGFLFQGPDWSFGDSPPQGLYYRPRIYRSVRGFDSFEPWLTRLREFPVEVIDDALKSLPSSWLGEDDADGDALHRLMERLLRRRARVPDLIAAARELPSNPFPNWLD